MRQICCKKDANVLKVCYLSAFYFLMRSKEKIQFEMLDRLIWTIIKIKKKLSTKPPRYTHFFLRTSILFNP